MADVFAHRRGDASHPKFGHHPNTAGSIGGAPKSHNMPVKQFQSPKSAHGNLSKLAAFVVRGY